MIKLKDLSEYYKIESYDRGKIQMLYHLTELGVYKVPEFKQTSSLEQILKDVEFRFKSFKYNSEFYSPFYRKGYFAEIVVHDWLKSKGFELDLFCSDYEIYVLKRSNVYGLTRGYLSLTFSDLCSNHYEYQFGHGELPKVINISLRTGDESSWVSVKEVKRDPDVIIKTLEGTINPLLLFDSASDLKFSTEFRSQN